MRIGLITPEPGHPLLAAATALLAREHLVEPVHPDSAPPDRVADVYLLKSRTPTALALARALEARGAAVLNSASATGLCQDRTAMAELADRAGLPFAATRTFAALGPLPDQEDLTYPLVVKSRHSRRHDLVARADDSAGLRALAEGWAREPVVVQEFTANSGWDHKLWVIGGRVFAALRRSELAPGDRGPTRSLPLDALQPGWAALALRVGEVFALDVYGVDLIDVGGSPLIVDVNAFPGIRGQLGAPEALAELALAAGSGRLIPRTRARPAEESCSTP
ncbi:alpha-L-glutamate ligase [Streptomyces sp. ERV7]|uniref:ATP-grasp domain-containing protein n=1 Tax=Streptomyces sp. ERV7 TaxID=1322334 RepID=UPI0007F54164|nr:alpha-L-glutamate ligase [Streptomyces sp. ERV7]OAR21959.1 alpha-L-glutamate ligase [Streptomyces sp. ERV7]